MGYKYTDDDYCDLYEKKICDNCGKCLEENGVDIRAINIEDISKDVEENKLLEEEWKKEVEETQEVEVDEDEELKLAYTKLKDEFSDWNEDEEYIDAFEHIEYLDDMDFNDELTLEENTEEIFPGVRKLVIKDRK